MAHPERRNAPVHDELHPLIYRAMIGLTLWLVVSIWALFDRGSYFGLTLGVITLFFLIAVGIPVLLWLTWQHNTAPDERNRLNEPLRDWLSHLFETCTGVTTGKDAAAQVLLPIAAVAFGMTIFGLVFLFTVPQLGGY
jgi:hypothetical protein